jgi:hypothetical protein
VPDARGFRATIRATSGIGMNKKSQTLAAAMPSKPATRGNKQKARNSAISSSSQVPKPSEHDPKMVALLALTPSLNAALVIKRFSSACGELDLNALIDSLRNEVSAVGTGKMGRPEAMLVTQAHTLDSLFTYLARCAGREVTTSMEQLDTYLRLAFRAQSQCRATIEAINLMKNPPSATFVRQANLAHNQQINNGPPASRAGETENQPSKLLEQQDGERLEFGTAGQAGSSDPAMAALETIDRPKDN